jgi:hypothetical protein
MESKSEDFPLPISPYIIYNFPLSIFKFTFFKIITWSSTESIELYSSSAAFTLFGISSSILTLIWFKSILTFLLLRLVLTFFSVGMRLLAYYFYFISSKVFGFIKNYPFFIAIEKLPYFLLSVRLCLFCLISLTDKNMSILFMELITDINYEIAFGNCWEVTSNTTAIIIVVKTLAGDISWLM